MKIQSLLIAASLALVPATVANADDAKKEALKKAKEAAKEKAKEAIKEKIEKKEEVAEKKAEVKKAEAKKGAEEAAAAAAAAAEAEKATHAKNLGAIERLEQIAGATGTAELTAVVTRLKDKESKRAALAAPPAAPEHPAKK